MVSNRDSGARAIRKSESVADPLASGEATKAGLGRRLSEYSFASLFAICHVNELYGDGTPTITNEGHLCIENVRQRATHNDNSGSYSCSGINH